MARKQKSWLRIGVGLVALVGGLLIAYRQMLRPTMTGAAAPVPFHSFRYVGASFSINHTKWLSDEWGGPGTGKQWETVLDELLDLDIGCLRLAVQWNQVERSDGNFDFTEVEYVLDRCQVRGVPVLLCVGVKAPRWPEVHLPQQYKALAQTQGDELASHELNTTKQGISKPLRRYVRTMLERYGNDPRVEAIQIENEPLEPFGNPKLSVALATLKEEVELARTKTSKPIAVTFGAGLTGTLDRMKRQRQQILDDLLSLKTDWVGLDLYQRGFVRYGSLPSWPFNASNEHWRIADRFMEQVRVTGKVPFLAELQAEPWETDPNRVDFHHPDGNGSLTPASYAAVLRNACQLTGVDRVYLWGLEFQLACANQGNTAWLEVTKDFLQKRPKPDPVAD